MNSALKHICINFLPIVNSGVLTKIHIDSLRNKIEFNSLKKELNIIYKLSSNYKIKKLNLR